MAVLNGPAFGSRLSRHPLSLRRTRSVYFLAGGEGGTPPGRAQRSEEAEPVLKPIEPDRHSRPKDSRSETGRGGDFSISGEPSSRRSARQPRPRTNYQILARREPAPAAGLPGRQSLPERCCCGRPPERRIP